MSTVDEILELLGYGFEDEGSSDSYDPDPEDDPENEDLEDDDDFEDDEDLEEDFEDREDEEELEIERPANPFTEEV